MLYFFILFIIYGAPHSYRLRPGLLVLPSYQSPGVTTRFGFTHRQMPGGQARGQNKPRNWDFHKGGKCRGGGGVGEAQKSRKIKVLRMEFAWCGNS